MLLAIGCAPAAPRSQSISDIKLWTVVATQDIPKGTVLKPHHMRGRSIPFFEARGGYAMGEKSPLIGKTLSCDAKAGEPITSPMIEGNELSPPFKPVATPRLD